MTERLAHDERLIVVSYETMQELLERENYITNLLMAHIQNTEQYIRETYISQNETKYFINFIISPKYRQD